MTLDQFKSQVILLLQQLIKLSKIEQQEAIIFLKNNIDNISYIEDEKCVATESDNFPNCLNDDHSGDDTGEPEILEQLDVDKENNRNGEPSDLSKQSSEEFIHNDTSTKETEADDINRISHPVKSSKKKGKTRTPVHCAICKKSFRALPSILRHLSEHDGTQISCINCKRRFNNYIVFNLHNSICKMGKNVKRGKGSPFVFDRKKLANLQLSKVICCPFCGEYFSNGSNLRRHIDNKRCRNSDNKKGQVIHCKYCTKTFTSQDGHHEHVKNKHMRSCDICGPLIMPVRDWKRHKKTHEQEEISKTYTCEVCSQHFRTRRILREHLRSQHSSDIKPSEPKINSDTRYECKECSYVSNNLSNLQRHKNLKHKTCSIDKRFSCHKCPMMFKLHNALKEHLASVHSTERSLVCPLCPASFKLSSMLTRHMAGHGSASLVCGCCHQRFRRHDGLRRHLRKHIAKPDPPQETTMEMLPPQEIAVIPPQTLELATPECSELIISTPARSELVSLMDLQSGEMLTLSPADYMLYLSS